MGMLGGVLASHLCPEPGCWGGDSPGAQGATEAAVEGAGPCRGQEFTLPRFKFAVVNV